MTETDRLLEVLYPVLKEKVGHMPLCKAMEIADALLAKGVLAPPVKVGDTMDKDKQIEEMARKNCHFEYHMRDYKTCKECYEANYRACRVYDVCRNLYNAGYRKQSEVTSAIFADIDNAKLISKVVRGGAVIYESPVSIDELKKKYGVTDTNVGSKDEEGK